MWGQGALCDSKQRPRCVGVTSRKTESMTWEDTACAKALRWERGLDYRSQGSWEEGGLRGARWHKSPSGR